MSETPSLFSVDGEEACPVPFSLGEISELEILTTLPLQGRGKEGTIGCGGLPILDGSRGVAGRAV